MSYPIIILGAGASHDYIHPTHGGFSSKPPLTDELVSQRNPNILKKYPAVEALFSDLAPRIKDGRSFETCLQDFSSSGHAHRREQIKALKSYLKEFFQDVSSHYHYSPLNNYKVLGNTFRDVLADGEAEKICIVSFNYDTLFEKNVALFPHSGKRQIEMGDYINEPIKLIKIHGSSDWSYAENVPDLGTSVYHDSFLHERSVALRSPAVALPLPETKTYICPESHIEELKKALQVTDKILIIGWKAGDPYLLKLMRKNISRKVLVYIVSRDKESAEGIEGRLKDCDGAHRFSFKTAEGGFSTFISEDSAIREFFRTSVVGPIDPI